MLFPGLPCLAVHHLAVEVGRDFPDIGIAIGIVQPKPFASGVDLHLTIEGRRCYFPMFSPVFAVQRQEVLAHEAAIIDYSRSTLQ